MDFGISLDPSSVPQRHALYDSDEEDEQTEIQFPEYTFSPSAVDFPHSNTLLIAVDTTACVFLKSHFVLTPLTSLEGNTPTIFEGAYFPKGGEKCSVSELMRGGEQTLVCLHEKRLKLEYVNSWAKMLFEKLRPSSVLVFTTLPAFAHHGAELSPQTSFLNTIATASWPHPFHKEATPLAPPNTLSGETAAALTWCQLRSIPAAVWVLCTLSSESMSEQVAKFSPVLDHSLLSSVTRRATSEAVKLVKTLEPRPREDLSTLYT